MKLWAIQPEELYIKLTKDKILYCDYESKDYAASIYKFFVKCYGLMAEEMKLRIGELPEVVKYPFWAWALVKGINQRPDYRLSYYSDEEEKVLLELEIPEKDLLLSDEASWTSLLINIENLYLSLESSDWLKIFDKNHKDNDWKDIQATFLGA